MNDFVLWMQGLDAQKVAANESFHSASHRQAMQIHEFEKMRRQLRPNLMQAHEEKLAQIGENWKLKQARKTRELKFTEQQLQTALKAGHR